MAVQVVFAFVVLVMAGCAPAPAPAASASAQAPAQPVAATMPQAVPPAASSPDRLSGAVLETLDSGGYTYLKIATDKGEVWAAVKQAKVKAGENATVLGSLWMDNFESKTLDRKFGRILFGALDTGAAAPGAMPAGHPAMPGAMTGEMPAGHPQVGGVPPGHPAPTDGIADTKGISVPKAAGPEGRTVAEVFAQRAELKDKPVAVRGKVVKFLSGIMGRNWVHLRDGSGSRQGQDDDLTVTTDETVAVGDVVTARGKTAVDRDFGSGYSYKVIVEEAKLTK
jgi:hypothetical protein